MDLSCLEKRAQNRIVMGQKQGVNCAEVLGTIYDRDKLISHVEKGDQWDLTWLEGPQQDRNGPETAIKFAEVPYRHQVSECPL